MDYIERIKMLKSQKKITNDKLEKAPHFASLQIYVRYKNRKRSKTNLAPLNLSHLLRLVNIYAIEIYLRDNSIIILLAGIYLQYLELY